MRKISKAHAKRLVSLAFDAMCAKKSAAHARNALLSAIHCDDAQQRASFEASARFFQKCAATSSRDALNARAALV